MLENIETHLQIAFKVGSGCRNIGELSIDEMHQ